MVSRTQQLPECFWRQPLTDGGSSMHGRDFERNTGHLGLDHGCGCIERKQESHGELD